MHTHKLTMHNAPRPEQLNAFADNLVDGAENLGPLNYCNY